MKRTAKYGVITLSLALMISACGSKKSIEEIKSDFNKTVTSLNNYGLNATSQKDSYVVEVKNSKLLAKKILDSVEFYDLEGKYINFLSVLIDSAKFGVDTDWEKYKDHKPKSVYVYYLGDGKESNHTKELIAKKAIGAYLTFNKDDKLTNIDIKGIDDKFITKGTTNQLKLTGANIVITPQEGTKQKYTLDSGNLMISDSRGNIFNFSGLKCNADMENKYIGTKHCEAPKITGLFTTANGKKTKLLMENIVADNTGKTESSNVIQDVKFLISKIEMNTEGRKNVNLNLENIKLDFTTKTKEEFYKNIYALYKQIDPSSQSSKEVMAKIFNVSGDRMKNTTFKYNLGIDTFNINTEQGKYKSLFKLSKYSQIGDWNFKDKFGYGDTIKIDTINMNMMGKELFNLKSLEYTTKLSNLYNFWSDYLKDFGTIYTKAKTNPAKMNQEINKLLSKVGPKIVNEGLSYSINPITFDKLVVPDKKKGGNIELSKVLINLDATLAKNDIKFDNPQLAKMMLLKYLNSKGHIELSKKDFELITKKSPQMMMIAMFAKIKGDKVIFDLEFKDGHLKVNGKPVM